MEAVLFEAHFASTWLLVGLIWVVQLAIYPQYASVGRREFRAYHERYANGITWVVAPAMAIEGLTGAWLLVSPEWAEQRLLFGAGFALILFNAAHTAFLAVPLHGRLGAGFDEATHRKLVRTNVLRTIAWTARGLLLFLAIR